MDNFQGINEPSPEGNLIWEMTYPDNYSVFEQREIVSSYNCYNFTILPSNKGQISIRVIARLSIFSLNDIYLTAQVSRDFHVFKPEYFNYKDLIAFLIGRTHEEFIYFFETRSASIFSLSKFRPKIDYELVEKIAAIPKTIN